MITLLKKTLRLIGMATPWALALALVHAPANAASAPSSGGVLEEITVTAAKRGEPSTQDVPAAIQAISGEQLAKIGDIKTPLACRIHDVDATLP